MTKQEFDEAVDRLRREGRKAVERLQREGRVFIAVGLVMKHRLGLPDDWPWGGPTDAELAQFLADLNRAQRKSLKIAEGLETETISMDEYLAETGQAERSVH
jgi:hypothetical protein